MFLEDSLFIKWQTRVIAPRVKRKIAFFASEFLNFYKK